MPNLSPDDIYHLSHLSSLAITEEEQARFAEQLSSIVHYVEQLQQVDVSTAGPATGVTGLTNVLAADQPRQANDQIAIDPTVIVTAAPVNQDGYFLTRAPLGDE